MAHDSAENNRRRLFLTGTILKKISEAELKSDFSLEQNSKQASLTFWCGIAGAISCAVLIVLFINYINSIESLIDEKKKDASIGSYEARIEINQFITEKTIAFNQIALPLFMGANFAWVVGGFAWSFDIGKRPSNAGVRRIGAILTFSTAATCCYLWYLLLSRYSAG